MVVGSVRVSISIPFHLVITNRKQVQPFGHIGHTRSDIETSRKQKSKGGNGIAEEFYDWTEKQVAPFL